MADQNRAVIHRGTRHVEVENVPDAGFVLKDGPGVHPDNVGRELPHAVILEVVATDICGSDQHMVRGRTDAPEGLQLGHKITGEVIEAGPESSSSRSATSSRCRSTSPVDAVATASSATPTSA